MGASLEQLLGNVIGRSLQQMGPLDLLKGRIWIEDSRHTAQVLVDIDIADEGYAGPHGAPMRDFTQLMKDAQDPEALRRESLRLHDESIAIARLAEEIEERKRGTDGSS